MAEAEISIIDLAPGQDRLVNETAQLLYVVDSVYQRQGIGSALVRAFEDAVRDHGGITIWLGSDDENGIGKPDIYVAKRINVRKEKK